MLGPQLGQCPTQWTGHSLTWQAVCCVGLVAQMAVLGRPFRSWTVFSTLCLVFCPGPQVVEHADQADHAVDHSHGTLHAAVLISGHLAPWQASSPFAGHAAPPFMACVVTWKIFVLRPVSLLQVASVAVPRCVVLGDPSSLCVFQLIQAAQLPAQLTAQLAVSSVP